MARAGTKIGAGYVSVEPDLTGFQEEVEQALRRRLGGLGEKSGKQLGDDIRKGVRRSGSPIDESFFRPILQKFGKAGQDASRRFARGMRSEKRQRERDVSDALGLGAMSDFYREAQKAAKGLNPLQRALQRVRPHARGLAGDLQRGWRAAGAGPRAFGRALDGLQRSMVRVNTRMLFFRNIIRLLRWPAVITGVGLLTQGLAALTAGFFAAASAAGTMSGALIALPALAATAAQAFSALKLATMGVGDTIKAALDAQVKGGGQAVDSLKRQRDATDRVADAERAYTQAQEATEASRKAVNDALRAARRDYRDLEAAAGRSYLVEEEGALRVKELRDALDDALKNGSELDIRVAENSFEQAKLDLKDIRAEAKRARQDYKAAAQAGGADQMPEVVAARKARADARQAEADAERDLNRAVQDSTDAMGSQGAAADKLAEEMGKLPPAAQAFVRQIVALKPKMDELRATAASGLFPGVSDGLTGMLRNFPVAKTLIGETATAMGDLARRTGKKIGSKEWGRDLLTIGRQNTRTLNQMGASGLNLADTFRHLLVTARPFINWMGRGVERLTGWMKTSAKTGRENGKLAAYFDRVKETMQAIGPILKGVGGGFLNLSKAARPLGMDILRALGGAAEGWRKWTGSVEGQNSLRKYFKDAKPAIFETGRLIRDATKAFFEIGNQPGAAKLIKQVRTELLPALTDTIGTLTSHFGPALVGALTSGVKLMQSLAHQSGPLVLVAKALGGIATGLTWVIEKVPGVKHLIAALVVLKAMSFAASITGLAKFGRVIVATTMAHRALAASQGLVATMSKRGIVATVAAKVAMVAATAATKAWAFAQRILNLALTMNPIGLVVTAIGALGFALYVAWKKSDTFRRIVTGAFDAVVDAGKWMADKYLGYITMILGGFSSLATGASKLPIIGGKFKGVANAIDDVRDKIDGFREQLRDGDKDAAKTRGLKAQQNEVDRLKAKLGTLEKGTDAYRNTAEKLRKKQRELNQAIADAKKPAQGASRAYRVLGGNVGSLGAETANVSNYVLDGTNKILGEFGADPIKTKVKPWKRAAQQVADAVSGIGRQRGGPVELAKGAVVPGQGTGDTVPLHVGGRLAAMVEPGELVSVANRKATAALMRVNKAVPRFQGGGIVELLHPFNDPKGHGGGNSHLHIAARTVQAIVALGHKLQKRGWLVGEHPAFGGVGGMHDPDGHHYSARAIDVNWPDPGQEAAKIKALLPMLGGAAGGLLGDMASKIGRLKVSGGTDTTRSLLQGAADRLRKGANAYLAKALAPIEGVETVLHGDGDVESVFAKTAKRLSKSKIATLALGMAGYAESGMQDLDYGDASSKGSLQLLASTAAGLGVSPHDEAAVSSLFLTRGFYGRGGANALAAQGLPAHLVAQNVQGSAFSDGSNYLAQEGRARAWMKRFGLQKGGLVRMVGDSLGDGTVRLGGLASKLKQKLIANVLTGRPALGSAGLFSGAAKQLIFDLGTNDTSAGAPANVLRAVDRATGDTPIHALTLNGPLADAKNAALRKLGGGDVNLIPWAAKSAGLLEPDGYHATGAGYGKRATMIAKAVNAKAAAMKRAVQDKARKGKTKTGGIGAPIGQVDVSEMGIPQAIKQSLKRVRRPQKKKGVRKKQMARLMARINEQFSLPPDLLQRLAGFERDIPIWQDRGDRADSLTVELTDADGEPILDPEGRQAVELGRMEGQTAGQWKQRELGGLLSYRNDLIEARVKVRELVEQVKARILEQQANVVALRKKIKRQGLVRGKLGELVAAKRKPNKLKAKIKQLAGEAAAGLRNKDLFGKAFENLKAKTLIAEKIPAIQARMGAVSAHRAASVRERTAITGKVLPALTGRRDALTEDGGTYEDQLDSVQGLGGGRERADKFFGQVPDYFGQFSGQIFDAHDQLKALNTPGPIIKKTPDDPDHSGNLDAAIFDRYYGVEALQALQENITAGMQRLVPFGGVFHTGGVVPGPVGQERMALVQSGEGVFTPDQMAQLQPRGGDGISVTLVAEEGAGVDLNKLRVIARDEAGREIDVREQRERTQQRARIRG